MAERQGAGIPGDGFGGGGMRNYCIEWGVTSLFAFPLAVGFEPQEGAHPASIMLHIGPFFIDFQWRDLA
jgi:hypothetical protein